MIPDDAVAQVRSRTDLLALIGQNVELSRSGGSYKGLCPFHSEKTPSFYVHPDRQFFHCFGCGASGDAIAYLMKFEGRTFPDAVEFLAERAGIELVRADDGAHSDARRRNAYKERLYGVMEDAALFYKEQLHGDQDAAVARDELRRRSLSPDAIEAFSLGFAPPAWDALASYLSRRGHSPADAEAAGLLVARKQAQGHYDRFRQRLTFPVRDIRGRVVAFSGRALASTDASDSKGEAAAKYINSPETPLFKKSDALLGLFECRLEIRRRGYALLCEGNFDVVSLWSHGFKNAVAPMGTAVTPAQAQLLRKFTEHVVLLFDGDAAGDKAIRASQSVLAQGKLSAKVCQLPSGEDPDSFLRNFDIGELEQRIEGAQGIVEYLIDRTADSVGNTAADRAIAIESLGAVVASVRSPVEAQLYVERVAQAFGVSDLGIVRQQLRRGVRKGTHRTNVPQSRLDGRNGSQLQSLECEVVGLALDHPELVNSSLRETIQKLLTNDDLGTIFRITGGMIQSHGKIDVASLLEQSPPGPTRVWLEQRLARQDLDSSEAEATIDRVVSQLWRRRVEGQLPRMDQKILEARRMGDHERADVLTREKQALFRSATSGWGVGAQPETNNGGLEPQPS